MHNSKGHEAVGEEAKECDEFYVDLLQFLIKSEQTDSTIISVITKVCCQYFISKGISKKSALNCFEKMYDFEKLLLEKKI